MWSLVTPTMKFYELASSRAHQSACGVTMNQTIECWTVEAQEPPEVRKERAR